jgi:hypothetical protein
LLVNQKHYDDYCQSFDESIELGIESFEVNPSYDFIFYFFLTNVKDSYIGLEIAMKAKQIGK